MVSGADTAAGGADTAAGGTADITPAAAAGVGGFLWLLPRWCFLTGGARAELFLVLLDCCRILRIASSAALDPLPLLVFLPLLLPSDNDSCDRKYFMILLNNPNIVVVMFLFVTKLLKMVNRWL